MSMNFGREQSLLRQRLQATGSAELAATRQQQLPGTTTFLGAEDDEVRAAAEDLAAAYPQMGRAQMTAFVRTLWQSKIHELRAVGAELLAMRASLLEPADLPFLEGLLKDDTLDGVASRLAGDVLGALVDKNKKLWKDLRRLANNSNQNLRRAAVRATGLPVLADAESFPRFRELVEPMVATADAAMLLAVDEVLTRIAAQHDAAVKEFAARHGRTIKLPKAKKATATKTVMPSKAPGTAAAKASTSPARKKSAAKAKAPASSSRPAKRQ